MRGARKEILKTVTAINWRWSACRRVCRWKSLEVVRCVDEEGAGRYCRYKHPNVYEETKRAGEERRERTVKWKGWLQVPNLRTASVVLIEADLHLERELKKQSKRRKRVDGTSEQRVVVVENKKHEQAQGRWGNRRIFEGLVYSGKRCS